MEKEFSEFILVANLRVFFAVGNNLNTQSIHLLLINYGISIHWNVYNIMIIII